MNRIFLTVIFATLFLTAGTIDKTQIFRADSNQILKLENESKIPVIDYNKIKKGTSLFNFFPVYFYLSLDKCNSIVEKIKKEEVVDVEVCVGFNLIDDFHFLRLELITPDESVYQNINIFVDKLGTPPQMVRYNNDYIPYNVMKPVILRNAEFVTSKVPIAGSSIQTHNLVGKWKINLFIDDSSEKFGSISFELE